MIWIRNVHAYYYYYYYYTTHHCDECWAHGMRTGQCTPPHWEVDAELEKEDTRRPRIKTPRANKAEHSSLYTANTSIAAHAQLLARFYLH